MNNSKEVIRVSVSNNFNCTDEEYQQLEKFAEQNPDAFFFTNSNIKTPRLAAINSHPYKAVITSNPDLRVDPNLVERLYDIDSGKIGFVRVKWLPEKADIRSLVERLLEHHIPVVITPQRFNGKKHLAEYTDLRHYERSCSRYRIHGAAKKEMCSMIYQLSKLGYPIHLCDRKGVGCEGCGLCSMLTKGGKGHKLLSLNLSSSGICPYSCPDCYAKTMQNFLVKCGKRPIQFDVIKANKKQAGLTAHIQNIKKAHKKG